VPQSNLEKQLSEMKHNNQTLLLKNREMQSKITEQSNTIDSLKSQLETLNGSLRSRDASLAKESANRRDAEIEIEKLHVKIDETERALESSNKPVESENSQLEALRVRNSESSHILPHANFMQQIALCAVCRGRFKNTAIRTCGHVFCRQCADERIASRSRKCPNCGRAFAATDLFSVHL